MKFLYGGIIILCYVLMIGFTYRTLPMKLRSVDRDPYIVYQDEKYYGKINDGLWYNLEDGFIIESETGTGTKYSLFRTEMSIIDHMDSITIFEGDLEIGACDYTRECVDYDLSDEYSIDDLKEFVSILTVIEPNDPMIFKNANLQSFLLLETFAYIMMVLLLSFGLMKHEKAKVFLSSLHDYFHKNRIIKEEEPSKRRIIILHRGSLILGIGILLCLIYVIIGIYTL